MNDRMAEWRREREEVQAHMRAVVELARDEVGRRSRWTLSATDFIDDGMQGGYVFATPRKNVVVRVGPEDSLENELALTDPEYAGGVVKVYGLRLVLDETAYFRDGRWGDESDDWYDPDWCDKPDVHYVVTWKQRIDESVEWHIRNALPPSKANEILYALSGIGWSQDFAARLETLRSWRGTRGLARALANGLRCNDIDLSQNIGVTPRGRVVAFDL